MNKEELIDKLIRGEAFTTAEQLSYDTFVESDPDFVESIALIKELEQPLRVENRKQLKDLLIETESEIETPESKIFPLRKLMVMAASFVAIIAFSFLFKTSLQSDDLTEEFYSPYPSIVNPLIKGEIDDREVEDKAFTLYQQLEYQQAQLLFGEIVEPSDTIRFYKAITQIETQNLIAARAEFSALGNAQGRFAEEAKWYEIIVLLKMGEKNRAKEKLNILIEDNPEHVYYEEATLLLKEL